jgi:hypothetical protein
MTLRGRGDLIRELEARIADLEKALRNAEQDKNSAYSERNKLVAHLTMLYPACLERHPDEEEWEDDWRWIVFIHHPRGQLSWHIHDSELSLFDHVVRGIGNAKWDGHTTDEKYRRLLDATPLIRAAAWGKNAMADWPLDATGICPNCDAGLPTACTCPDEARGK